MHKSFHIVRIVNLHLFFMYALLILKFHIVLHWPLINAIIHLISSNVFRLFCAISLFFDFAFIRPTSKSYPAVHRWIVQFLHTKICWVIQWILPVVLTCLICLWHLNCSHCAPCLFLFHFRVSLYFFFVSVPLLHSASLPLIFLLSLSLLLFFISGLQKIVKCAWHRRYSCICSNELMKISPVEHSTSNTLYTDLYAAIHIGYSNSVEILLSMIWQKLHITAASFCIENRIHLIPNIEKKNNNVESNENWVVNGNMNRTSERVRE